MYGNTNGWQTDPYQMQPTMIPDPIMVEKEKRDMKSSFSRCGWATLAVSLFSIVAATILSFVILLLQKQGYSANAFYSKYSLVFNEILIGSAIAFGLLFLIGMEKAVPERRKLTAKNFFVPLIICFPVSYLGNKIGNAVISFWNSISGSNAANDLSEVLFSVNTWQMVLCVGIIAPIIEEFFFRKLLIDRLYRYGELTAILVSGLLFGLFHQNFGQFFYAFGTGVIFGFIYCRTGSYGLVALLHMAFNLIMGVLPALLSERLFGFFELLENSQAENITSILQNAWPAYGIPLMLYGIYLLATGILNITGVVLFIVKVRKIHLNPGKTLLNASQKRGAAFLNSGMLAAIIVMGILMLISLG